MTKVIELNSYRKEQHKIWWEQNKHRIDSIIKRFFEGQWAIDFATLADSYQAAPDYALPAWDYLDFRDMIFEAISGKEIIDIIHDHLKSRSWYREQWLSRDRIVERCVSMYVLSEAPSLVRSS